MVVHDVQSAQDVHGMLQVGFETEGTAIFDTMQFVKNEVSALTVLIPTPQLPPAL